MFKKMNNQDTDLEKIFSCVDSIHKKKTSLNHKKDNTNLFIGQKTDQFTKDNMQSSIST